MVDQHAVTLEYSQGKSTLKQNSSAYKNYNHFHNILKLFDVLRNFLFTTSETMRDYNL